MKKYKILYRFKGNFKFNEMPCNESFIKASSKKEAKEIFLASMYDAECEAKVIKII